MSAVWRSPLDGAPLALSIHRANWFTFDPGVAILITVLCALMLATSIALVVLRRLVASQGETIRKKTQCEAALERRYQTVFERSLAGFLISTVEGKIVECNAAFARLFGYDSPTELSETSAQALYFDPVDRKNKIKKLLATGTITGQEMCVRRRDGEALWLLETAGIEILPDGTRQILSSVIDSTERKQAEAALARQHHLLEALINHIPDPVYVKDLESRFIVGNTAASQRVGAPTPQAVVGKTDADFYPPELARQYREDE